MKVEAGKVVTAYEEPKKPKSIYELLRAKSWMDWEKAKADANETVDKEELPEKIWEATKAEFHRHLDSELAKKERHFRFLNQRWGLNEVLGTLVVHF